MDSRNFCWLSLSVNYKLHSSCGIVPLWMGRLCEWAPPSRPLTFSLVGVFQIWVPLGLFLMSGKERMSLFSTCAYLELWPGMLLGVEGKAVTGRLCFRWPVLVLAPRNATPTEPCGIWGGSLVAGLLPREEVSGDNGQVWDFKWTSVPRPKDCGMKD